MNNIIVISQQFKVNLFNLLRRYCKVSAGGSTVRLSAWYTPKKKKNRGCSSKRRSGSVGRTELTLRNTGRGGEPTRSSGEAVSVSVWVRERRQDEWRRCGHEHALPLWRWRHAYGRETGGKCVRACVCVRACEGKSTGDIKQSLHLTNLQTNMTVLSDTATSGSTLIL